jgi:hypothetical protein
MFHPGPIWPNSEMDKKWHKFFWHWAGSRILWVFFLKAFDTISMHFAPFIKVGKLTLDSCEFCS